MLGEFFLYSEKEAIEQGIEYNKEWWNAEAGQMTLTDDGYVVLLRKRQEFKTKIGYTTNFSFPHGRFLTTTNFRDGGFHKPVNSVEIRMSLKGSFNNCSNQTYEDRQTKRKKVKEAVKLAAGMLVYRGRINYEILGNMIAHADASPELTAKRIFKLDKVRQMMENEIELLLKGNNINKQTALELLTDAASLAKNNSDAETLLKVYDRMAPLTGLTQPKGQKIMESIEMSSVQFLGDEIEKNEKKLLATRSEETK